MKNLTSIALTAACVFAIAGSVFLVQHRALRSLRAQRTARLQQVMLLESERPSPRPTPSSSTPPPPEPPAAAANGSRLVEKLVAALEQKRAALEEAGDTAAAEVWAERLAILLDLPPDQSESARTFFHQLMVEARAVSVRQDLDDAAKHQAFAALEQRLAEFLITRYGEDQAARFRTAEQARQEAAIEHEAGLALHNVAQVVDLPPAQKDALYTAFAEKARARTSTFAPGELKPQFAYAFQEGPRVEDPMTLARPILTEEQIALYEKNRTSEAHEQQREMQTALHVMREVFDQALGEAPPAAGGGPK